MRGVRLEQFTPEQLAAATVTTVNRAVLGEEDDIQSVTTGHLSEPPRRGRRPHKYNARKTVVAGVTFDSEREAKRWVQLCALAASGAILFLRRQVSFALMAPGADGEPFVVERYRADFVYHLSSGERVVEDAKGFRTDDYRRKRKWMERQHGISIVEV